MPVTITWFNDEKTILLYTLETPWTWEEFDASFQQSFMMTEQVKQPVDAIIDSSRSRQMPRGILIQGGKMLEQLRQPENVGILLVVSASSVGKMAIQLFQRMYPQNRIEIFFTDSIEEAITIIESHHNS